MCCGCLGESAQKSPAGAKYRRRRSCPNSIRGRVGGYIFATMPRRSKDSQEACRKDEAPLACRPVALMRPHWVVQV